MDAARPSDERGLSNVVGVVILMATVVLIIGGVAAFSGGTFDSAKTEVDIKLVERDLTKLSGVIHDISFGSNTVRTTGLNLQTVDSEGSTLVKSGAGHITVKVSQTTGTDVVFDGPLGSVEYRNKQTLVAYQGGGVWRKGPNGASVVDPGAFSLENQSSKTLLLPVLVVNGNATLSSGATVRLKSDPTYSKYKLGDGETGTITIQSKYYSAWGRYFTDHLDVPASQVSLDDSTQTVSVTYGASDGEYLHIGVYQIIVDEN